MSWELWGVASLGLLAWFFWDGLTCREQAILAAKQECGRSGVQFLDETVSLVRLRLGRDRDQRVKLLRNYAFEFSDDGDNRIRGEVHLLGRAVQNVSVVLPAGPEKIVSAVVVPFPGRQC